MPTYPYACTACDHQLEAVQSFTDDPLTECPQCQGRLRKRYGSVGVVFKGSGFYRTDSRANGNGASRTKSSSSPSSSEKSDSAAKSSDSGKSSGKEKTASSS